MRHSFCPDHFDFCRLIYYYATHSIKLCDKIVVNFTIFCQYFIIFSFSALFSGTISAFFRLLLDLLFFLRLRLFDIDFCVRSSDIWY